MVSILARIADSSTWNEAGFREWNFFEGNFLEPYGEGRDKLVNLTELFALLMFIIGLLTLIVEVIRLTFEVTTFFQKQEHDNKKD